MRVHMYMYIYMYICIYVCIYACVCIHIHSRVHVYVYVCIPLYVYIHTSVCACHVCRCVCVYLCINVTSIPLIARVCSDLTGVSTDSVAYRNADLSLLLAAAGSGIILALARNDLGRHLRLPPLLSSTASAFAQCKLHSQLECVVSKIRDSGQETYTNNKVAAHYIIDYSYCFV